MAFEHFHTPNQLALSLSSANEGEIQKAQSAMKGIGHVKYHLWDWLDREEYLQSRKGDIFFIGFQENLAQDFEILISKLGLPRSINLPSDHIHSHKNPDNLDKHLDDEAIANLNHWYKTDYECIRICRTLIGELGLNQV
jgi:hypothetical protein